MKNQQKEKDLQRDLPLQTIRPQVQVFVIADEKRGDYDIIGHGYLQIMTDQSAEETVYYIHVEKKTVPGTLMKSRVRLKCNFQRQKGTIITWRDEEQPVYPQLAVSFEQVKQCDYFWRLICEKVGQHYLNISGKQVLELPTQTNLAVVLEKTKTCKDLLQYNLQNSLDYLISLDNVFRKFQSKKDKVGMGMVGKILKTIIANMDLNIVEPMFSDPSFGLILQTESLNRKINYVKFWASKVKVKSILPLNEKLNNKIRVYYRIAFYKQNLLDLMKQIYFQHILIQTQNDFCKEIVKQFIKENFFEQLIQLSALPPNLQTVPLVKDQALDQTSSSENSALKKRLLYEAKIDLLLEILVKVKLITSSNLKTKFLDRLYSSEIIKMVTQIMDQNIPKALDFFLSLAQLNPSRFFQHLKQKFRQSPSQSLHSKLAKRYCLGTQDMQIAIIETVKSFGQVFKTKENLDFFIGSFFAYTFQCCKNEKALLMLVSDVQNIISNVESFFLQTLKGKIFQKIMPFLRNIMRDKLSQLRAVKILKRVLLQNSENAEFKIVFLKQINNQLISSGFFQYCMTILSKNIKLNNIVCSSMLQNLKLIKQFKKYTVYHKQIQLNYSTADYLQKYIAHILTVKPQKSQDESTSTNPLSHQLELEQQKQESYLMQENNEYAIEKDVPEIQVINSQLQQLKRIRQEIIKEEKENEEANNVTIVRKVKKENESQPVQIEINLEFDESLEGME